MPKVLTLQVQRRTPGQTCALLALLLVFGGVAAGQKKTQGAQASGDELAKAPVTARGWRNPYAGESEAVLAGRKLFARHCAGCHGSDGRGQEQAPDLRTAVVQGAPPGVLFWFLKNGSLREGMPSWSRLPDQRLWQLVSYLQTLPPEKDAASE